jgi:hypothetical protein
MKDNEKNQADNDKHGITSDDLFLNYHKEQEQSAHEKLLAEAKAEEAAAEQERREREEYAKQLADDRVNLLKVKAGLSDGDKFEDKSPPKQPMSAREKIENFWYHYKWTVLVTALIIIVMVYLIYGIIFNVKPDMKIMAISGDTNLQVFTEQIADALVPYCPDYNGDGKIYIQVTYIPPNNAVGVDPSYAQAMSAKMFVEFESDETIIVLTDPATAEAIGVSQDVFDNPADWFTSNYNELGYEVSATPLAADIKYQNLDPNMVAAFRFAKPGFGNMEKFETNYQNAHQLWQNFIDGNKVSEGAVNYAP